MMSGSAEVTKLLLNHGADVFAADNEGEMPIHFAAAEDHHHLINFLADAGNLFKTIPQIIYVFSFCGITKYVVLIKCNSPQKIKT